MKKCPYCSAEILDESEFCLYCMRQLTPKKAVASNPPKAYLWVFIISVLSAFILCAVVFLIIMFAPRKQDFTSSEASATIYNTDIYDDFSSDISNIENSITISSPDNLKAPHNSEVENSLETNGTTTSPTEIDKPNDNNTSSIPIENNASSIISSDDNFFQPTESAPSSSEESAQKPVQIWSIKDVNGGIEITGIANLDATGNYEVPAQIDGKDVIGIGDKAFYYEEGIKTITLPGTLKYIGEQAFAGCTSITKIVIPTNVTEIKSGAFVPCENLSDIYIESTDVKIAAYAFSCVYQRSVSLTIHAPIGVVDALQAKISWDAEYEEWNG